MSYDDYRFYISDYHYCPIKVKNMFFIFLLSQRHLHPLDVENRPNGLTINIFIGRQVGTGVHKSD